MGNERTKKLGFNIKIERLRKQLKQETLGELIDMSRNSVSLIERGLQNPSALALIDIAKALDVDLNELIKGV